MHSTVSLRPFVNDTDPTRVAHGRRRQPPGPPSNGVPAANATTEPESPPLTEAEVARTRPDPREARWLQDRGPTRVPGLRLRIGPTGSKHWYVAYRPETGRQCTAALGSWPTISLARARLLAAQLRDAIRRSRDVEPGGGPTFSEVAEQLWLEAFFDPNAPRRGGAVRRRLDHRILPTFGHRAIAWITAADLTDWYEALARDSAREADLSIGLVSHVFRHAATRGLIDRNPCRQVRRRHRAERHRRPETEELRRLRLAIGRERHDTDRTLYVALALALVTGEPERELLGLRWADVDFDDRTITLPVARNRTREISVPPNVLAGLFSLPRRGHHVFRNPNSGRPYTTVHTVWNRLRRAARADHLWMSDLSHYARTTGEPELLRVIKALLDQR